MGDASNIDVLQELAPVLHGSARARRGTDEFTFPASTLNHSHIVKSEVLSLHLLSEFLNTRGSYREFSHGEVIGTVEGHLRVDIIVEPLDDRDDGDDGQNADDDTQQCQECPEFICPQ